MTLDSTSEEQQNKKRKHEFKAAEEVPIVPKKEPNARPRLPSSRPQTRMVKPRSNSGCQTCVHVSGVIKERKAMPSFLHPRQPIINPSCRIRMQKIVSQDLRMRTLKPQDLTLFRFLSLKSIDSIIQLPTSKPCTLLSTHLSPKERRIFGPLFRFLYSWRLICECKRGKSLTNG